MLVEAEKLNENLFSKEQGVDQLGVYLSIKNFKSDVGIATNGFDWVLLKFDYKIYKAIQIKHLDLRLLFFSALDSLRGQQSLVDQKVSLQEFSKYFAKEYVLDSIDDFSRELEHRKEEITSAFYENYIRYVFGYDRNTGLHGKSLLSSLRAPSASNEESKRLFVNTLMSRLIFIKFFEDNSKFATKSF